MRANLLFFRASCCLLSLLSSQFSVRVWEIVSGYKQAINLPLFDLHFPCQELICEQLDASLKEEQAKVSALTEEKAKLLNRLQELRSQAVCDTKPSAQVEVLLPDLGVHSLSRGKGVVVSFSFVARPRQHIHPATLGTESGFSGTF